MHSRISSLSTLSRMVFRYHRHSLRSHFSLKKEQQSISEIASVAIRCRQSSFRNFCSAAREFPCHISRIYALKFSLEFLRLNCRIRVSRQFSKSKAVAVSNFQVSHLGLVFDRSGSRQHHSPCYLGNGIQLPCYLANHSVLTSASAASVWRRAGRRGRRRRPDGTRSPARPGRDTSAPATASGR